jgi:hypothetical protein
MLLLIYKQEKEGVKFQISFFRNVSKVARERTIEWDGC